MKNGGRHGSVKDTKAVGNKCTNAVASKTPVPKCLTMKSSLNGIRNRGVLETITGKAQAEADTVSIMKSAPTCVDRLYDSTSFPDPQKEVSCR